MRSSILWALIALFVGFSLFGIYKSLVLSRRNTSLQASLKESRNKLAITLASLTEAKGRLRESDLTNARLESEVSTLKTRLGNRENAIQEYLKQISLLTVSLKKADQVNVSLLEEYNNMASRVMRLELENVQMKKTFSSIEDLKKAIKELNVRKKVRAAVVKKTASRKEWRFFGRRPIQDTALSDLKGNRGFFVKDGKPTFEKMVELQVMPLESSAY